ncbi:class I SAM-dependent methyltransferase [Clostridium sediminicola]|uniref:class I SAM-dependent DNA methyltransferase n=1 Tax=Clostridium sediminicola TaxID=3114879 RepID=UPI0031F1F429
MKCYEEFAYIYDSLIYGDINYCKWAEKIFEICKGKCVCFDNYLDIACGTGNLTIEVTKYFKHTWGLDLSSDMLMEAENKFRTRNIKANFVCQDMTMIKLNKKFDLITSALDSANYITDSNNLKEFFRGVYNHLNDDGVFIFDINSYFKLSEILGNNLYTYDNEDVVYIWDNSFENDIVNMYLTFFIKNEEDYKRFDEYHTERAYKEEFLENMISSVGFEVNAKLDNYTDDEVNDKTERITYVLTK